MCVRSFLSAVASFVISFRMFVIAEMFFFMWYYYFGGCYMFGFLVVKNEINRKVVSWTIQFCIRHICANRTSTKKRATKLYLSISKWDWKVHAASKRVRKFLLSLAPLCARQFGRMSKSINSVDSNVWFVVMFAHFNWWLCKIKRKKNFQQAEWKHEPHIASSCIPFLFRLSEMLTQHHFELCLGTFSAFFTVSSVWRTAVYGFGLGCL